MVCSFDVVLYKLGIDLSHAFDTVDRQKLMETLEEDTNLNEDDCRLVRYLLSDVTLSVRVSQTSSSPFLSNAGVPEGDGLSPFLFIYYLDKALRKARSTLSLSHVRPPLDLSLGLPGLTAYADDVDTISSSQDYLEVELSVFEHELASWHFQLNKTKTERTKIDLCPLADCCPACRQVCATETILCDSCGFWWHFTCAHLSPTQVSALQADPTSTYKCDLCAKFERPLMRGQEPWRRVRLLGSLLDDDEDARNRMRLAAAAFRQHTKIWTRRHALPVPIRVRIYKAFVLPVLTYNIGALGVSKRMAESLDAFHRRQLRHVLGVFWPDQISNDALYGRTTSIPISCLAKEKRWTLFGHVLRLPRDVPAFVAMQAYFRATTLFHRRRGRPRTCLASVLSQDILDSFDKHHCLLQSLDDLERLRLKAQNRQVWKRWIRVVID